MSSDLKGSPADALPAGMRLLLDCNWAIVIVVNTTLTTVRLQANIAAYCAVVCRRGNGLSRCVLVYGGSGDRKLQQVQTDEWSAGASTNADCVQ